MLPYPQDLPTQRSQSLVRVDVAVMVARELPCPPVAVGSGKDAMDRAPMPEAPIDEDHEPPAGERQVDSSPWQPSNAHLDPKPAPAPVQLLTK